MILTRCPSVRCAACARDVLQGHGHERYPGSCAATTLPPELGAGGRSCWGMRNPRRKTQTEQDILPRTCSRAHRRGRGAGGPKIQRVPSCSVSQGCPCSPPPSGLVRANLPAGRRRSAAGSRSSVETAARARAVRMSSEQAVLPLSITRLPRELGWVGVSKTVLSVEKLPAAPILRSEVIEVRW